MVTLKNYYFHLFFSDRAICLDRRGARLQIDRCLTAADGVDVWSRETGCGWQIARPCPTGFPAVSDKLFRGSLYLMTSCPSSMTAWMRSVRFSSSIRWNMS